MEQSLASVREPFGVRDRVRSLHQAWGLKAPADPFLMVHGANVGVNPHKTASSNSIKVSKYAQRQSSGFRSVNPHHEF
jgi:hypothetical protein